MQKRVFLIGALLLLLGALILMGIDFFSDRSRPRENPYEYSLDKLRAVDPAEICYKEAGSFVPDVDMPACICIDEDDRIYVGGDDRVMLYSKEGKKISGFQTGGKSTCITTSISGDIFVGTDKQILCFNSDRRLLNSWNGPDDNTVFTSLAAGDEILYAADAGNRVVYQYDQDGTQTDNHGPM